MIKILNQDVDTESIEFEIHGKQLTLTYVDGKEIEAHLWEVHCAKMVKERQRTMKLRKEQGD